MMTSLGIYAQEKSPAEFLGETVFKENCLSCHGEKAKGIAKDWKVRMSNGRYPAPPLNGTAHAWHHSPGLLMKSIDNGGARIGGWMPPFKDKLSIEEKSSVIKYLFDLWPVEIQEKYKARFR